MQMGRARTATCCIHVAVTFNACFANRPNDQERKTGVSLLNPCREAHHAWRETTSPHFNYAPSSVSHGGFFRTHYRSETARARWALSREDSTPFFRPLEPLRG